MIQRIICSFQPKFHCQYTYRQFYHGDNIVCVRLGLEWYSWLTKQPVTLPQKNVRGNSSHFSVSVVILIDCVFLPPTINQLLVQTFCHGGFCPLGAIIVTQAIAFPAFWAIVRKSNVNSQVGGRKQFVICFPKHSKNRANFQTDNAVNAYSFRKIISNVKLFEFPFNSGSLWTLIGFSIRDPGPGLNFQFRIPLDLGLFPSRNENILFEPVISFCQCNALITFWEMTSSCTQTD